jgi:hypothetical protein
MNERTETPVARPPEPRPPHADWAVFEEALTSTLSVLKDEILVLSARTGGCYVQLHVSAASGVHAEAVSNAYLSEREKLSAEQVAALLSLGWTAPRPGTPAPASPSNFVREFARPFSCAEVAHLLVRTLADVHRVPAPDGLEYRAFDEPGKAVYLPALRLPRAEARPRKARPRRARRKTSPFQRLRHLVRQAARLGSGLGSLDYDDGGWLTVPVGGRTGYIQPHLNPTYVRVHLHLRSGVEADGDRLARFHAVNARLPLARLVFTDGNVYLGVDFPAVPFVPAHLHQAITALAQVADAVERDLGVPQAEPRAPAVN